MKSNKQSYEICAIIKRKYSVIAIIAEPVNPSVVGHFYDHGLTFFN